LRQITRRQRYDKKTETAKRFPIELATVNFHHDVNLAYLVRAAACFGISSINVIGAIPPRRAINQLSGSTLDYVQLRQFSTPSEFMDFSRRNNMNLVSVELEETAVPLKEYEFNFSSKLCIVAGHETTGIPSEILLSSDVVYIPMPGVGFCLNTSQASNIVLYEAINQFQNMSARI
jgi:tRNA G18 (ribose-2'-O)-methylase SpoU|tara:strand:- start:801 stop:1328 length:528 start_codon:yes stop_codon:yes gene_type:complete